MDETDRLDLVPPHLRWLDWSALALKSGPTHYIGKIPDSHQAVAVYWLGQSDRVDPSRRKWGARFHPATLASNVDLAEAFAAVDAALAENFPLLYMAHQNPARKMTMKKAVAKKVSKKTAAKVGAKAAGRAVPGIGQALMLIDGVPVAAAEAAGIVETVRKSQRRAKKKAAEGRYAESFKEAIGGAWEMQGEVIKGAGRTALAAVMAREAAEATRNGVRRAHSMKTRRNGTKGAYPFRQKEEQYASYSIEQLLFSLQDANEARLAMKGHDPIAEGWYADDAATIAAELRRRGELGRVKARKNRVRRNPAMSDGPLFQDVLAHLRALQWLYWTTHWTAAGPNYYGDHKLLQRLYEGKGGGPDINEEIDAVGERMVAYFGPQSVSPDVVARRAHELVEQAARSGDPIEALYDLEFSLQQAIRAAWQANQQTGMSLGVDDLLMGLANEREGAIYLLGRRLGGRKPLASTGAKS